MCCCFQGGVVRQVRDLTILLVHGASLEPQAAHIFMSLCVALCGHERGSRCHEIGTQALLNIALSAVRQKLDLEALQDVSLDVSVP